jgi:PAS domain S-box-containing protein
MSSRASLPYPEATSSELFEARRRAKLADEVSRIGRRIVAETSFDKIVQQLADEATSACGAAYGAFCYTVAGDAGESDLRFAVAGTSSEMLADLRSQRRTAYLEPGFLGRKVRLADVTTDPRHGPGELHYLIPRGTISVRSYLAVPVSSGSGEVLGGLFFGHPDADVFTGAHELIVTGVAEHAAIAIANARRLAAAQAAADELARTLAAVRATAAEAERDHRVLLESAQLGIWELDPVTGRLSWDARCKALFGLSATAEVDQAIFFAALHPDDRARIEAATASALDPSGSGRYDVEHRSIGVEDGVERWSASQGRALFEGGRAVRFIGTLRDITARKAAELEQLQSARRARLGADVGVAMAGSGTLDEQLRRSAQAIVVNVDAAFARIWTLDEPTQTLVLRASMGMYTHLDGPHSRVPVGAFKIGLIARERRAHLGDDVCSDPRVSDQAWAAREGMVAFAGYPLIVDERVVGVMAMFARRPLGVDVLHALAYVADAIAVGIERKRSEEERAALLAREHAALADAEGHRARLHSLFMKAPAVICILRGPDHVFELANAHYREILGDGRELVGRPMREAVPELAGGRIFAILDEVYASGEAFSGTEVRSVFGRSAAAGEPRREAFFNLVFQPTFDRRSRVDGILQIAFDVTDQVLARRRAERLGEQLRRSEERYRSLLEATNQTTWTSSPEGQMLGEQPDWAALTGQSQLEYQGHGWASAVHPDDRAHTLAAWQAAVSAVEVFVCEHRVRRRDGEWRHFRVSAAAVLEDDGSIREWFGVHTDVTDKKLVEVERERLIAELKRSNEDLDQFAYVTSHDLKAPLRGIANLSQWVEEDLADKISDEGRDQMRLLRGRVNRLEALINGILTYSRAGRIRETLELVDVGQLVREVVELVAPTTGIELTIPTALPTIVAERVPLQQVLMNLVSNAIKHAKKDAPRVTITCSKARDGYSFMVKDNGPGIAPAFHQRIWIIFQTLEPRDKVEATGIGLSIVKKIVESRGGRVWINSVPGDGAEFHFTWPARAKASP